MCYGTLVTFALAFGCGVITATAQARPDAELSIKYNEGQPMVLVGQIKAKGTFNVGKDSGFKVQEITIDCAPIQGGPLTTEKCKWKVGKWTGAISGLRVGTYNVKLSITVKDSNGKQIVWLAPISRIIVSAEVVPAKWPSLD
jgi:hypothetical protein